MSNIFIGPYGHKYRHGTSNGYVNGKCRCEPCTDNNRTRTKLTQLKKHRGTYESYFVPAEPSRQRVKLIMAETGWGAKYLAGLIGMSKNSLQALVYGRTPAEVAHGKLLHAAEVTRQNHNKIMAFKWSEDMGHNRALIKPKGFQRRVEALQCMGYSVDYIGAKMGTNGGNLKVMCERGFIRRENFVKMAKLYDELCMVRFAPTTKAERCSYTRTVNKAKKLKFAPPLSWDDIDLDDKPAVVEKDKELVDEVKLELMRSGQPVTISRSEVIPFTVALAESGMNQMEIARLMKTTGSAINKRLSRLAS